MRTRGREEGKARRLLLKRRATAARRLPQQEPVYAPMRIRDREWMKPKMFRSHTTTPITTTAFKMDLIDPAIGMKLLTSQSKTPTTIKTIKI
jgi:hypothetical protein